MESSSEMRATSKLSRCPRDLHSLWHEYEFGHGGSKPAREYTAVERGANKFAYSRRKVFWDAMDVLIRKGYTSDRAIDKLYTTYGLRTSVTKILSDMRRHRQRGENH